MGCSFLGLLYCGDQRGVFGGGTGISSHICGTRALVRVSVEGSKYRCLLSDERSGGVG